MSTRRAGNRFRTLLLLGVGISLALGSFWLLQVMQKDGLDATSNTSRNEPDYYVENFNFVRMAKTGEARYNIAGTRMTHRPLDDSYEITLPVIHSLSPGQPPLMARSERAIAEANNSKIHMYDKVVVDRPASATTDPFHMKTDYLMILPDEDVMQSDQAVELTLGSAKLNGVGMYVNNATREFRLAARVRGNYPPRATGNTKR